MKRRVLGRSGIDVTEIGVGAWQLGGPLRLDPAPAWNRTSDAIVVPGIAPDGTVTDVPRGAASTFASPTRP